MTNKEIVLQKYPKAKSERQKENSGKVYWLIRPQRYVMYIGCGDTEAKAWRDAAERITNKQ